MPQTIELTRGQSAIIDDADYAIVAVHSWHAVRPEPQTDRWYAQSRIGEGIIGLHSFIMGAGRGQIVDHIDGNSLNNCRSNLRFASNQQNIRNSRKTRRPTSSRYKGVSKARGGRWRSYITVDAKYINLGHYTTQEAAAEAYDRAAVQHFHDFARTNESLGLFRAA